MSERFRTWSKIYREKMNIKRESKMALGKRGSRGKEEVVMQDLCIEQATT